MHLLCWLVFFSLVSPFPVDSHPDQLDHASPSESDDFVRERGLLRRDNPQLKNWDIYQKYKKRAKTAPREEFPDYLITTTPEAAHQRDPKDPTSHLFTYDGRTVTMTDVFLGQGGDGTVYKGSLDQKDVAVKVSSSVSLAEGAHFMMVLDQWPNVIDLVAGFQAQFDDKSEKKSFFQVTPLMDGDLNGWLRKASNDDWQRHHKTIAQQALQGLLDMHKISVSHRDYKPDNILIQKKDGDIYAFVADLNRASRRVHTLTTGTGTEGYLSLESMLGPSFDSKKGDVFAAAMSMIVLLFKKRVILHQTLKLEWVTTIWKAILDAQNPKWPRFGKEYVTERIKRKVLLHDDFVDLLPGMDEELADVFARAMCPEKERLTLQMFMDQLLPLLPFEPCHEE